MPTPSPSRPSTPRRSARTRPFSLDPWFSAIGLALAFAGLLLAAPAHTQTRPPRASVPEETPARIEVAFVLDTTGSMAGLIEGAKRKIWSIANNLIDLEPKPEIRFALIGYRDRGDAYVTKRFDLTDDVQKIYGELLAFQAEGGGDTPESVNQALDEAVNGLVWSQEDEVFRVVFLVGDAPPHMDYPDDAPFPDTLAAAKARDIVVNAVQAGSMQPTTPIWREIAQLGGGEYARIAQDGAMVMVETPYDAEIQQLQHRLNDTVIEYGDAERRRATRDKLDAVKGASGLVVSDMASYLAKKGGGAVTGGGDLVEELESGRLKLGEVAPEAMPEALRELDPAARERYVEAQIRERRGLRERLDGLVAERDAYVLDRRAEIDDKDAFDREVERMITTQSRAKGFSPRTD